MEEILKAVKVTVRIMREELMAKDAGWDEGLATHDVGGKVSVMIMLCACITEPQGLQPREMVGILLHFLSSSVWLLRYSASRATVPGIKALIIWI